MPYRVVKKVLLKGRWSFVLMVILMVMLVGGTGKLALAVISENATGWSWGGGVTNNPAGYSGIGWISFNGANAQSGGGTYGVYIPQIDGELSGYAWSEHYGWISFNGSDISDCTPALLPARRANNTIVGGARILAIRTALSENNSGGYDGCIDLSGVSISGQSLSGYAWSSDLGWIDMSGVSVFLPLPQCSDTIDNDGDGLADYPNDPGCISPDDQEEMDPPTVTLEVCDAGICSGSDIIATAGDEHTLTWSSTNATICGATKGSGFETGGGVSGSDAVSPLATETYQVTCQSVAGSAIDSLIVYILSSPTLSAQPTRVRRGGSATLLGSLEGNTGCMLSGPGIDPADSNGDGDTNTLIIADGTSTFSYTTAPLEGESSYVLSCASYNGDPLRATVRVLPTYEEV